jgi:PAS domain S-box-containing protein
VTLTKRTFPSSAGDIITRLVLIAVASVSIAVIVGWHLHVRVLVQIPRGIIPMQYNTALCFIVLGVSGLLLVTRRGHRFLPVVGGAFLIAMGALVIYEYATGISLGIDTLLFYPWDLTLLKYPGRMALTSGVSFVSSGIALIWLSFRRQSLAPFAILHTLPLSLGLTSTLGYVAGITFVLPFQLGSQMAIHTAIAFFAYGVVMLLYAWRAATHTEQGIPKWAPAIGVLMVPILFVGIGITVQRNSTLGWAVPFFVGLLVAICFAVAAYKLTHSRINQKGLILISVPLMSLLIFVVLVTQMSRKSEQAQAWYLHSKEVILSTENIFNDLVDAEGSVRGYVLTGDSAFAEPYQRVTQEIPKEIETLHDLVKDNPAQQARAAKLGATAANKMSFLANVEQLMRTGARDLAVEKVKSGEGLQIISEFRRAREDFLKEEERLGLERHAAVQNAWQRFNWMLVAGGAVDLFLAVVLAVLFSGGISKRIVALTENAKTLADGSPLLSQPMTGTDEIAHLDHVFRDMAEALQEAARKERAIFDDALDLVCSFDAEGRFLKVSPSSFKVLAYRPEELIGRLYTEFLVPEEAQKSEQAVQEILAGKALTDFENRYRRKDGSVVDMQWSAWWSETENVMFAMARDITERKLAENAIKELNANLEKRTVQLEETNKELEAFSYSVSHDLRTPLRAIDGFSRILLEDHSEKLDADGARVLNVIRSNTQNMSRLIDDLLAFSRLGRKQVDRSSINMKELAADVSRQLNLATTEKTIRFNLGSLPPAYGDPALIRQVFVNLLSNAAKYSKTKDAPVIDVGACRENGEQVYYVKDNGIGFDMSHANKLFGVFQRLHSAEEFEGTGVGLAIVQRIIHRHGGRVWADGRVNEGATFYFSLPRENKTGGVHNTNEALLEVRP